MRKQSRRDTRCDVELPRVLHANGIRYSLDTRPLPNVNRRADLVLRKCKPAVFVDGCFWHGCSLHRAPSRSNAAWWREKIGRNKIRDADTNARLLAHGWTV